MTQPAARETVDSRHQDEAERPEAPLREDVPVQTYGPHPHGGIVHVHFHNPKVPHDH